jgi:hypothetical protein
VLFYFLNKLGVAYSFVGGTHDVTHDRPDDEQIVELRFGTKKFKK